MRITLSSLLIVGTFLIHQTASAQRNVISRADVEHALSDSLQFCEKERPSCGNRTNITTYGIRGLDSATLNTMPRCREGLNLAHHYVSRLTFDGRRVSDEARNHASLMRYLLATAVLANRANNCSSSRSDVWVFCPQRAYWDQLPRFSGNSETRRSALNPPPDFIRDLNRIQRQFPDVCGAPTISAAASSQKVDECQEAHDGETLEFWRCAGIEAFAKFADSLVVKCRADVSNSTSCDPVRKFDHPNNPSYQLMGRLGGNRKFVAIAGETCWSNAAKLRKYVLDHEDDPSHREAVRYAREKYHDIVAASLTKTFARCGSDFCPTPGFWQSSTGIRIRSENQPAGTRAPGDISGDSLTLFRDCRDPMIDCACYRGDEFLFSLGRKPRSQCRGPC